MYCSYCTCKLTYKCTCIVPICLHGRFSAHTADANIHVDSGLLLKVFTTYAGLAGMKTNVFLLKK